MMKKRRTRLLSMVLALAMLLTTMPVSALAGDVVDSGTCGENLKWSLESGTLTISGTGDMWDYEVNSHAPCYENRS